MTTGVRRVAPEETVVPRALLAEKDEELRAAGAALAAKDASFRRRGPSQLPRNTAGLQRKRLRLRSSQLRPGFLTVAESVCVFITI